jgi:SH3-like domain-containing protein
LINEPRRASRTTEPVKPYGSGERRSMSRTYALSAGMVSLFALPDGSSKQVGRVKPDATARMYLRSGEWDLLQAGDQIGWARRQLTSASN